MMRYSGWIAGAFVAGAAIGCGGSSDPLAGKSQKNLEAMQAADQKKADDEEMEHARSRKKAKAAGAKG